MAFDVSALSAWTQEKGDRADFILQPILGSDTLSKLTGIDKRYGIKGFTEQLPTFETTTPWQAGSACNFTTSGTTTLGKIQLTTVPISIQETICPRTLETYSLQGLVSKKGLDETFALMDMWTGRKLKSLSKQIDSALWQSKTTYTNATHLHKFNGFISTLDTAGTAIAATQQASISTSTVRGIIEEIAFSKIPAQIRGENPVILCGYDTFNTYRLKLMQDNLYHVDPSNTNMGEYRMKVFGTNVELIGIAGLNNDNSVDTGALPTAVKNRLIATYQDNLMIGMNAENDINEFDVWYSKDDQNIKFNLRFHIGVQIKYPALCVQYTNS
mgnify:CR=1 FL=1